MVCSASSLATMAAVSPERSWKPNRGDREEGGEKKKKTSDEVRSEGKVRKRGES